MCHCLMPPPEQPEVCDRPWAAPELCQDCAIGLQQWDQGGALGKITPASCEKGIISSWAEAAYNMHIRT